MTGGEPPLVLLVEDDVMVRQITDRALSAAGFRVLIASSAEAALAVLTGPDGPGIAAVVCDEGLPVMNGRQLLSLARRQRPGIFAVLISGDDFSASTPDAGFEFLGKPYQMADLIALLRRATR